MTQFLPSGTILASRYRLLQHLGSGGFANTYLATDSHFPDGSRLVAVKEFYLKHINHREQKTGDILTTYKSQTPSFDHLRNRFFNEAMRMHELHHPGIVSVTDVFEEGGTAYFVMDYLAKGTLYTHACKLTERQATDYTRQVLNALTVLHRANICHLDIKPTNILLDDDENAVLTDFGASILLDADFTTGENELLFSPGYAPIEQLCRDTKNIGPWTDIYAVGATLHFLLTGKIPPLPTTPHAISNDLHIDGADQGVKDFIRTCLARDFRQRPQSAQEAIELLDKAQPSDSFLATATTDEPDEEAPSGFIFTESAPTTDETTNETPTTKKNTFRYGAFIDALFVLIIAGAAYLIFSQRNYPIQEASPSQSVPLTVMLPDSVPLHLTQVEGGTFTMGATAEQILHFEYDELPTRPVCLDDYYIGRTEVTQQQWEAIMGYNPSKFPSPENPVENVSRQDCLLFIKRLNALRHDLLPPTLATCRFRLPTEAEWEYAARGGRHAHGFLHSGSNRVDDVAWYKENSHSGMKHRTHPVAKKQPNELGLYDMSGNVWEHCQDIYQNCYDSLATNNPTGPTEGSTYAARGGSFSDDARGQRITDRNWFLPSARVPRLGLRLVLAPR